MKPTLSSLFALGNRVIVKVGECYLEIGPEGTDALTDEIIQKLNN
jgi:hypothetical protein